MLSISGHTADNKRFSEMAVGVETEVRLRPLNTYGILRCGAPNPPLRQAAGRYVQLTLVRCEFFDDSVLEVLGNINGIFCIWEKKYG